MNVGVAVLVVIGVIVPRTALACVSLYLWLLLRLLRGHVGYLHLSKVSRMCSSSLCTS